MAEDSKKTITEWKIHHTVSGGHFVDREQFGEFLRSDQGRAMIKRAAEAVVIKPRRKRTEDGDQPRS